MTVAIIDFETTGLSPDHGARVIEVAVIICEEDRIVYRYQSLINPNVDIPYRITEITGIKKSDLYGAPSPAEVISKINELVSDRTLVAHNASFDKKFLLNEGMLCNTKFNNVRRQNIWDKQSPKLRETFAS
jgi:DNA polymerase-3 subunit epsilon